MSRSFVHVLLSLVLLFTQQMSMLHVTTHVGEARAAQAAQAGEAGQPVGKAKPALRDFCAQCLDGAQLAFAMPAPQHVFLPPALAYGPPAVRRGIGIDPQALYVFQPRGPPPVR